ncbi:MAG: polysaccharide lyase family 8 super-sandwich domain-containing protein [Cyclobacteriaceae bacterium]
MQAFRRITLRAFTTFALIFALFFTIRAQNADLEKIRKRVIFEVMEPEVDYTHIAHLINTIQGDGSWPGINYEDTSRTGFEHSRHLSYMVDLSHAYKKSHTKYYQDKKTRKTLKKALNYWFENDFICENWWWNQIGTPDRFVTILLIMDDDLTDKEKESAATIMARSTLSAWGARPGGDRIKIAGIYGKYGLFLRDEAILQEVVNTMATEIQYAVDRGTPNDIRGLQTDLSFHHRGDRVNNTLSYGLNYAAIFAEWAAKVGDTQYSFPDRAIQLLVDYYLDGICKMLVFGTYPDLGAKNRSISRVSALHAHGVDTPKKLILASDYRNDELAEIIRIRNGNAKPNLTGSKFFWHSEYYSHQRPGYFSSVRMYSTRNRSMEEPYNGEGLKNHHLGEGSNFVYQTGKEYYNIFPVLDWQKIPGATVVQKRTMPPENEIQKTGLTDFVGGVTNGLHGAVAFDFQSPYHSLEARKSWFFFDEEYVCLGTQINSEEEEPVFTTLNQTWLKGEVSVFEEGKIRQLEQGEHKLQNVQWINHDGVAYILPTNTSLGISNQLETGSWFSINRQSDSPKELVSGDVFTAWIDHGARPSNASYQYVVVPGMTNEKIEAYRKDLPIQILANTPEIQAVRNKKTQTTQLVFYQPGKVRISDDFHLISRSPCMVMVESEGSDPMQISIADPTRKLEAVEILINREITEGDSYEVSWDDIDGYSTLYIDLPQGDYAGQSVVIEW